MQMKHAAAVGRLLVALASALIFSGTSAIAETLTVTLPPVAFGSARDGGSATEFQDGDFDALLPGETLRVGQESLEYVANYRALYEFGLPAELLEPGVIIHRATLAVPIVAAHWSSWTPYHLLTWHAYAADATVTLEDFETYNRISEERLDVGLSGAYRAVDVLKYVQYLPGSGTERFGFVAETATEEEWGSGAMLEIDYSPPSLTDPGLSVYSPLPYADYWADSPVPLRATAQDPQDGNLDAQIYWTDSIDGAVVPLGSGGELSVQLPPGNHEITATVADSDGHQAIAIVRVTISSARNTPPAVTITSPADGAEFIAGQPVTFSASALDPEQGDISQTIFWADDTTQQLLGNGANITATFSAGTHTILAIATDSSGDRGIAVVNVNVVPPLEYCAAAGYAGHEWIAAVTLIPPNSPDSHKASGSNGGYADFTSTLMRVEKGANTIVLNSGYSFTINPYKEYWNVWIDLDRDGVFEPEEALASGYGARYIMRTLTIPESAAPGPARMRVAMSRNSPPIACVHGFFGEVEDYTVVIP